MRRRRRIRRMRRRIRRSGYHLQSLWSMKQEAATS
jgi:hypothetical protein